MQYSGNSVCLCEWPLEFILKIIWKCKRPRIADVVLNKNNKPGDLHTLSWSYMLHTTSWSHMLHTLSWSYILHYRDHACYIYYMIIHVAVAVQSINWASWKLVWKMTHLHFYFVLKSVPDRSKIQTGKHIKACDSLSTQSLALRRHFFFFIFSSSASPPHP